MGLRQAWPDAEIVGVDSKPQLRYPFEFLQMDWADAPFEWADFIWASPVCKRYTQMLNHGRTDRNVHGDFIPSVRTELERRGKPFVIENVMAAPIRQDLMLCGEMFGLCVLRHRKFECSFNVIQPNHIPHKGKCKRKQGDGGYYLRVYGHETGKPLWGNAMGIDWMKSPELAQAVPPAYSEYIARQYDIYRKVA